MSRKNILMKRLLVQINLNHLYMKKNQNPMRTLIVLIALLMFIPPVFAQEEEETVTSTEKSEKDKRPVKNSFESGYLINSMTCIIPTANTLEFIIQHRFGLLKSESFDMFGLYAPSNIRMGLNYTITDRIMVGAGSTKFNKLQDVQWKIALLRQTRSGSMPISLTYFGNAAVDVRSDIFPKFTNRLSYFHQFIISKKITDRLSLQLAPSYFHFNIVDSLKVHSNIALSFNGRFKVSDVSSVIFEYDQLLTKQNTELQPKPNLGIGFETATSAHAFQIFVGTFNAIIPQHNLFYNQNDFTKGEMLLGFNITRLWNF
jgi:hypothetical protein